EALAEPQSPRSILVFDDYAIRVATGIRRVVVCAVIVYRPVHELQVAVAARSIDIEEISRTEFAHTNFQPARGQLSRETEWPTFGRDGVLRSRCRGQRNDLPNHQARDIRSRTESRIAHHV